MKKLVALTFMAITFLLTACTFNVSCDSLDLVDKIHKANQMPGEDTLELAKGCTYELTWIEDMTNGNNGLPVISTDLVINGNYATIKRTENADHFRIFQVGTKAKLTLNQLTIRNGYADGEEDNYLVDRGGAILNLGNLSIDTALITDNYAGYVGGIYNHEGVVNIRKSTISRNNADSLTNGIINAGNAEMNIYQSTISENGLITYGDAIWNNGTLRMYNSTISDNNGIGIENDKDASGPGVVILEYVTFSGNAAALNSVTETIYIKNTLFGPHLNNACSTFTTVSGVGTNMDTDGSCNITTVSPNSLKLGPLYNNGGKTRTHKLGQGSVAIDGATGDCPENDQRGVHRPQYAACDVGSFENDDPVVQQEPEQKCKYTTLTNLFCRLGPSSSQYPKIDSFTPGQVGEVLGISPDGNFVQIIGGVNQLPCYAPVKGQYLELSGACGDLPVLDPPPTPVPAEKPGNGDGGQEPGNGDGGPEEGCWVRQVGGDTICVAPCPAGAAPGTACTIP